MDEVKTMSIVIESDMAMEVAVDVAGVAVDDIVIDRSMASSLR